MSYSRIDELQELRRMLILNLQTCEGMGWRDEERYDEISSKLSVVEEELSKLEGTYK